MVEKRRFALIGPSFFSYIQAIRNGLVAKGFNSDYFDERHANSILVKILYRLGFYSIFSRRKDRHLREILAKVLDGKFTDVLLIDVEVCNLRFVNFLVNSGVRVHLYMWDSAKNKSGFLRYLHLLQGKSSFDALDCEKYGLTYIPLFAEDVFSQKHQNSSVINERNNDLSFCGTLHSNRAKLIGELADFAKQQDLVISLMLYFHSRLLLGLKSIFYVSNIRFIFCISTKGYTKQQIFEMFSKSKFVFDLPHPGQTGLTARTFEVLRSGAQLITLNSKAKSLLPASLSKRVHCISTISDLKCIDFSAKYQEVVLADTDDYFLSLDRFIDQILDLTKISRR